MGSGKLSEESVSGRRKRSQDSNRSTERMDHWGWQCGGCDLDKQFWLNWVGLNKNGKTAIGDTFSHFLFVIHLIISDASQLL